MLLKFELLSCTTHTLTHTNIVDFILKLSLLARPTVSSWILMNAIAYQTAIPMGYRYLPTLLFSFIFYFLHFQHAAFFPQGPVQLHQQRNVQS